MARKLATIQTIKQLLPIEGADRIQLATFESIEWQCVVKKDEFKVGSRCVYFEIDSLLPLIPEFEFLAKGNSTKKMLLDTGETVQGYRLKSAKLRGVLSQGLALPLTTFNEYLRERVKSYKTNFSEETTSKFRITIAKDRISFKIPTEHTDNEMFNYYLGAFKLIKANIDNEKTFRGNVYATGDFNYLLDNEDLTEFLNVYKYEPPIPAEIVGKVKGTFPNFIPKTDETRIQVCLKDIEKYKDEDWVATLKFDGTSCTIHKYNNEFGVSSRNYELKEDPNNTLWKVANNYNLRNKLPEGYAIQGEVIGNGIQKNKHKINAQDIRIFNVYSILDKRYLNHQEASDFANKLGLKFVDVIYKGKLPSLEEMFKLADDTKLEGLVFRPKTEKTDPNLGRLSFKVISNKYLLT